MNGDHVDRHHVTTTEENVLGAVKVLVAAVVHVGVIAILLGDGEVHAGLDEAWRDHVQVMIGYCESPLCDKPILVSTRPITDRSLNLP